MLTDNFITLCKNFAKEHPDVLSENIEDTKKGCKYKIEFYGHILEFRYIKKESVFYKPSSLYCVLYLKKHSIVYYHLTDIIPLLNKKSFDPCYFFNIESAERLNYCFEHLVKTLNIVTSQIEQFLFDDSLLLSNLCKNYKFIYKLEEHDIDFEKIDDETDYSHTFFKKLQDTRDGYLFSRFSTFKPYSLLLSNKKSKAIEKYDKLNTNGKLLEYEKQLLCFIKNSDDDFSLLDAECNTVSILHKFMAFSSFAKAFVLIFAVGSILFCSIFAICNLIISYKTVYCLSAPWYSGFICAALCAIFGAIAFFQYIPNQKLTKEQRKNLSNIFIPKGEKIFSLLAFLASVIVAFLFAVLMMSENVRFYEDTVKFDTHTYTYNQIEGVYHIESRYNIYDERIERASYVILFKDKTSLDLDGYTSIRYTEKHILPFFKNKNIEISSVDSEKQLPWYTE